MVKKTIRFKPDNKVFYGQDFRCFVGAPAGVEFEVVKMKGTGCWLKAPGYGGKPYGNGKLYIPYANQRR